MKIRTQLNDGGRRLNHNETLRIRSTVKAGACAGGQHIPEVKQ